MRGEVDSRPPSGDLCKWEGRGEMWGRWLEGCWGKGSWFHLQQGQGRAVREVGRLVAEWEGLRGGRVGGRALSQGLEVQSAVVTNPERAQNSTNCGPGEEKCLKNHKKEKVYATNLYQR